MQYVLFDCTQFITFDAVDDGASIQQALGDLGDMGFKIVAGGDIEPRKLEYLADYLSATAVELFDQEFLGDLLEDWGEEDEIPPRVERFAEIITRLARSRVVRNLKVLLVEQAGQVKQYIVRRRARVADIRRAFFEMTDRPGHAPARILVVEIEDD